MRELVANNEPHIPKPIYEQKNPFLIIKLKVLRKQHLTISNTVQMLNMIFSLQLLATAIITFSDITIILYYYILHALHNELWSIMPVVNHMYCLSRMAYNFIRIAMIVWACETGKDQALQISTSVHDMFNRITDRKIKNELHLFSLQTFHCENTFSAKGLTVNAKFLAAIVGSIVTYILILFQFMRMSHLCERKPNNITGEI
ncbi:PREDICTED: putative gustatory receptor 28b [Wasmannia auropunctata]|uniref:putative gustatory receptor 28b n=1 Tax=Wasmannia auropunctata TaxID=64793 RepID=UPI0005EF6FFC|nr:PREDICTED: putative gustatory receptor 28b [Wasmannia auropunctata]